MIKSEERRRIVSPPPGLSSRHKLPEVMSTGTTTPKLHRRAVAVVAAGVETKSVGAIDDFEIGTGTRGDNRPLLVRTPAALPLADRRTVSRVAETVEEPSAGDAAQRIETVAERDDPLLIVAAAAVPLTDRRAVGAHAEVVEITS